MKAKITLLLLVSLVMASCSVENEETNLNENTANLETQGGDPPVCPSPTLIAGQNTPIGTVSVFYDGTNITVVYETNGNWTLELTHLWIGDCDNLPTNNPGNPIIGQFPYSESHPGATTFTYVIPASDFDGIVNICVAAHAEVIGATSETAWAEGISFPGNNWAMYFPIECL